MRAHLSIPDIDARIEALESCIGHLDLDWTDDATERKQGKLLQKQFRRQVDRLVDLKHADQVAV